MVASDLHFEVHKQHIENKTPENKASSSVEQLYPGGNEQVQWHQHHLHRYHKRHPAVKPTTSWS